ncbi:hypothetical protein O6H91_15G016700 [Diphasiastrum complanatum]|uniref:Uncharacterized protein n=2 Tax=Diphasiastrum complanatum TaxID=34168 RepID=A0ACC2BG68_DIPCM|nr:hypothetical protein O6H91_15G016700 [Diphasiastrum complanatum]KAJ7528737.1 hypothetical protein O6H91_15G016700 [Diphasiastrum complanatum]
MFLWKKLRSTRTGSRSEEFTVEKRKTALEKQGQKLFSILKNGETISLFSSPPEKKLLDAIKEQLYGKCKLEITRQRLDEMPGEELPTLSLFTRTHEGLFKHNVSKKFKIHWDPSKFCSEERQSQYLLEGANLSTSLRIYTVTWNMNGKLPCSNLAKLIDGGNGGFDIYVVGLQEAPNCFIESFLADVLGKSYSLISTSTMLSLQLFIFAKISIQPFISDMRVDRVGVGGFGGVVGRQKGAVAVALRFRRTSFLFVACHLAPHESNLVERNAQYTRICDNLFRPTAGGWSCLQNTAVLTSDSTKQASSTSVVEKYDVVIWLGDLNYRVEGSRNSVGLLIKHNLEKFLWEKDQLSREFQRGRIFSGFREGPLSFRPTYKYDIGTDEYDTSTKERVPSWTDRILFKVKYKSIIRADVQGYDSIDTLKTSDHRPVKAHVRVRSIK